MIDPKPLIDALGTLQQSQLKIKSDIEEHTHKSEVDSKPINFESFEIFRRGLADLISKAEIDLGMQAALVKSIIHKIEVLVDGFEIHFHVGEAHYTQALGDWSSNASYFFGSSSSKIVLNESEVLKYSASRIVMNNSSRRLTNGGPGENRTPTSLRTPDFESSVSTN